MKSALLILILLVSGIFQAAAQLPVDQWYPVGRCQNGKPWQSLLSFYGRPPVESHGASEVILHKMDNGSPSGRGTRYIFDSKGRLLSAHDLRDQGLQLKMVYDNDRLVMEQRYDVGDPNGFRGFAFEYDADRRLMSASFFVYGDGHYEWVSTEYFNYDSVGRLAFRATVPIDSGANPTDTSSSMVFRYTDTSITIEHRPSTRQSAHATLL